MRKTSFIIFSTISLILIVGLVFFDRIKESFSSDIILAQVIAIEGNAMIQSSGSSNWEPLLLKDYIRDGDVIKSNFKSELTLRFVPSSQIKILQNSQFFLKKEMGKILLNLQSGEIEVLVEPKEDSLFIAENGERIDAALYNQKKKDSLNVTSDLILPVATISTEVSSESPNDQIESAEVPAITEAKAPALGNEKTKSILNSALRNKVLSQNNFFYRCYSNLLQKEPNEKGKVIINFQVENRGEISHTEIVHSDFKNQEFLMCLREVIKRTRFESFAGDPIVTQIPLVFEAEKQ